MDCDSNFNSNILDELKSLSFESLIDVLNNFVTSLKNLTNTLDYKIPLINKSVSESVSFVNDLSDMIVEIRKSGFTSIQSIEKKIQNKLSEIGFKEIEDVPSLFELKLEGDVLSFVFNFKKGFDSVERFNFGGDNACLSGNADLKVLGDLAFSFDAKINKSGESWDFVLNKPVELNANVQILGEKLAFDLGMDLPIGNGWDNALSQLVKIGANDNTAYVVLGAGLKVSAGDEGLGFSNISVNNDNGSWEMPAGGSLSIELLLDLYGRLPVSVCDYSVGDIFTGQVVWRKPFLKVLFKKLLITAVMKKT